MDKNTFKNDLKNAKNNGRVYTKDECEQTIEKNCCFCVKSKSQKRMTLMGGCVTNFGIFILLLAYTLLGAFIFLAIEGSAAKMHQKALATTSHQSKIRATTFKPNITLNLTSSELRSQTVENIWEITVSLNILYKENWTRLAAAEISRFQEKLVAKVSAELAAQLEPPKLAEQRTKEIVAYGGSEDYEWNFAKAFLYSLTVLTTIGYGSVTPRTGIGKAVTIGYAVIGIPLTLLYLSVVGALLSQLVRAVCGRCLCKGHSPCCADGVKNKHDKKFNSKDSSGLSLNTQEPYYVRSPSGTIISASQAIKERNSFNILKDCDSLSCTDTESKTTFGSLTLLLPIVFCVTFIFFYIFLGAGILHYLEGWPAIDGVYFCFMSLSTIGFGSVLPNSSSIGKTNNTTTIWFCSVYIITGLALTAMCLNILHDEIVHKLKHQERSIKSKAHKAIAAEYLKKS